MASTIDNRGHVPRPHLKDCVGRNRTGGGSAHPSILQPREALCFIARTPAAKRPLRDPQHLRRLRQREFPALSPCIESSSNRIRLTSWRTVARVMVALLEGLP
jgi:hypothetical protein